MLKVMVLILIVCNYSTGDQLYKERRVYDSFIINTSAWDDCMYSGQKRARKLTEWFSHAGELSAEDKYRAAMLPPKPPEEPTITTNAYCHWELQPGRRI